MNPEQLRKLQSAGLSPADLVQAVLETEGDVTVPTNGVNYVGSPFRSDQAQLQKLQSAGWSPEDLLQAVRETDGDATLLTKRENRGSPFSSDPAQLQKLQSAGWSPEELLQAIQDPGEDASLPTKSVNGDNPFSSDPARLQKMQSAGWSPEELLQAMQDADDDGNENYPSRKRVKIDPHISQLDEKLKEFFGFDRFRPGQRAVVDAIMAKNNAMAIFPTGSGKSLCYQLPAMLILDGLTLVVSPLLALMKDQLESLRRKGFAADMLASNLSREERYATQDRLRNGITRLLFIAPEGLNNETTRNLILHRKVSLMVIDEVHCISEWGHAFRPDYLRLEQFARMCKAERVLGLTATATPKVEQDLRRCFQVAEGNCVRTTFHRPNLRLNYYSVTESNRDNILVGILRKHGNSGPCIIYVTAQQTTVEVAAYLSKIGFPATAYHAGMKIEEREQKQDEFMSNAGPYTKIMVCTIAFGMGVDKSNIRRIIHYNMPKSLEGYAQEIGRAGRDGLESDCDLLLCMDDLIVLEGFARCGGPTLKKLYYILKDIFLDHRGQPHPVGTVRELRLGRLAATYDLDEQTLRMLLAFLDIHHQVLETCTPKYNNYDLQFIDKRSVHSMPAYIRQRIPGIIGDALARNCTPNSSWANIDIDGCCQSSASGGVLTREAIVKALNTLENEVTVRASQVLQVYRILTVPACLKKLAEVEYNRFTSREKGELARIGEVLALVTASSCQCRLLMEHFGETPAAGFNCHQHCHFCRTGKPLVVKDRRHGASVDPNLWKQLTLVSGLPRDDPTLLARFAFGYKSPRLKSFYKNPLYGLFSGVCYEDIFDMCVSICDPTWNQLN